MFQEINKTAYPPTHPILVWDGECKFCKWWKTRWELKTKNQLDFKTYQEVASQFQDIPLKEFKKASRLIETDGAVYSGPDSAYRSLYISGNKKWHHWYSKNSWFEKLSDLGYNHIAKNRNFYYKATVILFGKDPVKPKLYWFYYLLLLILLIISL
jgi:predicted DCC family thiol-disulfide oxidoreductase YuxK